MKDFASLRAEGTPPFGQGGQVYLVLQIQFGLLSASSFPCRKLGKKNIGGYPIRRRGQVGLILQSCRPPDIIHTPAEVWIISERNCRRQRSLSCETKRLEDIPDFAVRPSLLLPHDKTCRLRLNASFCGRRCAWERLRLRRTVLSSMRRIQTSCLRKSVLGCCFQMRGCACRFCPKTSGRG